MVCEGHRPPLPVPHGSEASVCLVGDMGELGHHEPSAVALQADAHGLSLLGRFAMFGLPRTVAPLLTILTFDTFPGVVALDTAPFREEGRTGQSLSLCDLPP